jgi:thiol-disulfide isomerase/thioredoxin
MSKSLPHRRQFLYLGLGAAGAGVATTIGLATHQRQPTQSTAANQPALPSGSQQPEQANQASDVALAAEGKSLPEFQGIQQWLNSSPLTIADLKNQVVLIQFWTFACINCQRTLPYIVQWHQKYASQGLKVIGIHTAEFAFERDINNIKQALNKYRITYPVPVDNQYKTWRAYENEYWPHLFLADRQGLIRYDHIGEGEYDTTERMIQTLLKSA